MNSIVNNIKNTLQYAVMKALNPQIMRAVSDREIENMYKKSKKSFVDFLPFLEYLDESKSFLLDDTVSVAAVYTIKPYPTEGKSMESIIEHRETLQRIFQDVFSPSGSPWVVQQFNYADKNLGSIKGEIEKNIAPHAKGTEFTEEYLKIMSEHYQSIADNEEGIFKDTQVTNAQFRGQYRRCKLVFYKKNTDSEIKSSNFNPIQLLNEACERLESELEAANVTFSKDDGAAFFSWMLDWFNPNPSFYEKKSKFLAEMSYPDPEERPYGYDLAENLIFEDSHSDPENGCWWLNNEPTRFVRARLIRSAPKVGQISGELPKGDKGMASCMLDYLPEGSMLAQTMVIQSQSDVEIHVDRMLGKSHGDTSDVERSQRDINQIKDGMGGNQHIVKASFGVYVRGKDLISLDRATRETTALLGSAGIVCYPTDKDTLSTNAFIVHLPMAFEPKHEAKYKYLKHFYMQHMINLSLLFGRSEGSGHAVINFWNRGGSPLSFDFMNKDKASNSHMVIGGPTGAGKSVTLCYLASMIVATIRPRLFIFELGNSFGLLGDYMKSLGLNVVKKTLKPNSGVSLNPFADAHRVIEDEIQRLKSLNTELHEDDDESIDTDDQRDVMGEMLSAALLMITGGELKEQESLTRADKGLVSNAIRECAQENFDNNSEMITEHLRDKMVEISARLDDDKLDDDMRKMAKRMAASIDTFCHGFDGEVFNTAGGAWEDADVTIVDLATFAKEGYEAQMALTYISLMTHINALGERTQHDDRKIVQITDESHIVTVNPMLAPFLVKAVKVQRKIGITSILATQNFTDYPDAAKKLLNMIDWWLCLCPTKDEVEEISRFKELSPERKKMMTSCRKLSRCYTEGVVLSTSLDEMLIRNIPPSLYLALAMTEKEEKSERRQLMEKHNISEVEAAKKVSQFLDQVRGLNDAAA